MSQLLQEYRERIVPALQKKLNITNVHAVPALKKIVVSMGVGSSIQDSKHLEEAVANLTQLSGQKPKITQARKSVAQFRLREGMQIGAMVTLRRGRMYEFAERLIRLALPRVRDFRGLNPKAFDGNGNYSLGLNEQLVFPEINADAVQHVQGMNITFVTSAKTNEEGRELLRELGLPLREQ
ncbi:50S ribosomal protein L5 [Thalassoroseus pseudoceratinae]|uniref:50S ribosomal protein L5 n=1 Tax=Thalassoroseus pseudoceratinae TaxID=2713176 RepID=UPI00141DCF14|nr:50S ribosomal protein L5 [Thalassoroseus pseudoceratinae]